MAYRKDVFLPKMAEYERRSMHWKDGDAKQMEVNVPPTLRDGEKEVVLVVHDECIIYSNDATKTIWQMNDQNEMRPKSNGQSEHVSGFVCACHGFVQMDMGDYCFESFQIIKPGKNNEGYWTNQDLVNQLQGHPTKTTPGWRGVMKHMAQLHLGKDLVWVFDNSANHHAKPPGSLSANDLNLGDGGKNVPKLRDTVWSGPDGTVHVQKMQNDSGVQKGVKTILIERGMWAPTMKLPDARALLDDQPDFAAQKEWLQEIVEGAGHEIIFVPKYHPELSFIEMMWGYVKCLLRRSCTFNYHHLHAKLPGALTGIPVASARRFSRHCFRFMDGYRHGLYGPILDFVMKKFKGHRRIDATSIDAIKVEFDNK